MSTADAGTDRAAVLRAQFDRGFAAPPAAGPGATVDLLLVTVGGELCALQVAELAAIATVTTLVPVPSDDGTLLGMVGLRGRLVPVFALAACLGMTGAGNGTDAAPRWMVVCDDDEPVALAFDHFDRFVRLPAAAIHGRGAGAPGELVRTADDVRRILELGAVVAALRGRTSHDRTAPGKEP